MALVAPKGNAANQFPPQKNIAPGTYPARLVQMIDYGLQPQKPYMGKDKPPAQEIGLTYELVDEFMKDEKGNDIEDKPRWISETLPFFGLFADKAKSTQRYKAFDPDEKWGGDFSQALDRPINVTVVNNASGEKVYDNVATISAMRPRDADACPKLVNTPKLFDLDKPDLGVFNSFPEWIKKKIQGNLNFNGSPLQKLLGEQPKPVEEKPKEEIKAEINSNPY
ncbi:hypothetical protein KW787_04125 [Candidatus Pacearchaeota archaeon]|nr:hypothetical protein [Candidatus Pacearchaeota archaeon]